MQPSVYQKHLMEDIVNRKNMNSNECEDDHENDELVEELIDPTDSTQEYVVDSIVLHIGKGRNDKHQISCVRWFGNTSANHTVSLWNTSQTRKHPRTLYYSLFATTE